MGDCHLTIDFLTGNLLHVVTVRVVLRQVKGVPCQLRVIAIMESKDTVVTTDGIKDIHTVIINSIKSTFK